MKDKYFVWFICIWIVVVLGLFQNMVLISKVRKLAKGDVTSLMLYDKGFEAGEREGFGKGYLSCYNGFGMNWIGSYNRFIELSQKYGSIHDTPWDEFVLEEKAVICMYGGSGSKMNHREIQEWVDKYSRIPMIVEINPLVMAE